jgi:gp32 DNA binding protein like
MNSFTSSMFESIKSALTKENTNSSNKQKDFLRTEVGNTYTVRLLPNIKDPSKTFLHYYSHGWNSFSTGQLITLVSPSTWGQRDPIAEERYRILRNGTDEEKEKARAIVRTERWLVNAYVINDPVNEENNNKVKILRFGRQLHKIIKDAMEGEEADELGPRIFDLSPKGVNLKIKVEKQGDYPTYVSSKFTSPKEVEGLDDESYDKIYKSVFDLESYISAKSYDELKAMLDTHYFCKTEPDDSEPIAQVKESSKPAIKQTVEIVKDPKASKPKETDESLEKLLEDL